MKAPHWPEWRTVETVSQWNAIALSMGACPHALEGTFPHEPRWPTEQFRDEFLRRLKVLNTARLGLVNQWDGGGWPYVALGEFAAFAKRCEWDMPPELEVLATSTQPAPTPAGGGRYTAAELKRAKQAYAELDKACQRKSASAIGKKAGMDREKVTAMVRAGDLPPDAAQRAPQKNRNTPQ